jgi:glycerol uptake facilitator-like aquaporin
MRPPPSLPRRLAAEALGTGLLVATVIGSGIMAERLAGGNAALALLCNTIATGAILVVLVAAFAPLSGAHFNPAVSAVSALRGELPLRDLAPYIAVQCLGGIAGTIVAHLMFELAPLAVGDHRRSGAGQWLGEAVATFALVLVILVGARNAPRAVPWLIGLVITAAYWFTSSTSFANPAVTFARGLTTTFAGIALRDVPLFVVAQLIGAAVAAAVAWALLD